MRAAHKPAAQTLLFSLNTPSSLLNSSLPETVHSVPSIYDYPTLSPTELHRLGAGYLGALSKNEPKQALCGNSEGWGPLSQLRYDFTPCFLDVGISTVAVF